MQSKVCTTCLEKKSLNEFCRQKGGMYGVGSRCKACSLVYKRELRKRPRADGSFSDSIQKKCSKCGEDKPITQFFKERDGKFGVHSLCKVCKQAVRKKWGENNREHFNEYMRKYNAEHPKSEEAKRRSGITRRKFIYGLSQEQQEAMYERQAHRCALCAKKSKLVVDHCHKTGAVRGLLCHGCNRGLQFYDNPEMHEKVLKYLNQPRQAGEPDQGE